MRRFIRTHFQKIALGHGILIMIALIAVGFIVLTFQGANILSLLAVASSSLSRSPVVLYITPYENTSLQVGEIGKFDININATVPINALGITLKFPQDMLEVVGFSKEKSFINLWTEETAINEDTGELHFSGGTTARGGFIGTSTTLTISVRAKKAGLAQIFFENAQVYGNDGKGNLIDDETHAITLNIPQAISAPTGAAAPSPGTAIATPSALEPKSSPLPRSADFNGDGKINLIDMSILALHMFSAYDPQYDLNMDGTINVTDLSILFSRMDSNK